MKPVSLAFARMALMVAVWLVPVAAPSAEAPAPASANSLAGWLLVAAPDIDDSRFSGAVIYIVHQDQDGALGIVINQPIGLRGYAEILDAMGEDAKGASGTVRIFAGGPLEKNVGFVLHGADYSDDQTLKVGGNFAVTSDAKILRALAAGQGPKRSLVAFGYAGWMPGQLEDELGHNDWYLTPADNALVFDDDRDSVWQRAFDRKTLRL
jgi:putative transcriptional regulator